MSFWNCQLKAGLPVDSETLARPRLLLFKASSFLSKEFRTQLKNKILQSSYRFFTICVNRAMAEAGAQSQKETKLKYLEFVQVAAFHAIVCFSNLYTFAKERSGSLKPGVQSVEERVKALVTPVVVKHQALPSDLLKSLDKKVDEYVVVLDLVVPATLKTIASRAIYVIHKTPEVARSVASGVQQSGVIDAVSGLGKVVYEKCEPTGKVIYKKYEEAAGQLVVSVWYSFQKVPFFPRFAKSAVFFSDKYNQTVQYTAGKGYKVSSYLPLLPTEKITKALSSHHEVEVSGEEDAAASGN